MRSAAFRAAAHEAASRYPGRDRFARHFAYNKLTRDPVFAHLFSEGLIRDGMRVLDLGCGQGLVGALFAERIGYRGIEPDARDVGRAMSALPGADIVAGDMRSADFGQADAILLIDVLHYIEPAQQLDVLRRARAALAPGGLLLLRVADPSPSLRFRTTLALDRLAMRLRGRRVGALHCRPVAEWRRLLEAEGLAVEAFPMSEGTPFANFLLVARYHRASP